MTCTIFLISLFFIVSCTFTHIYTLYVHVYVPIFVLANCYLKNICSKEKKKEITSSFSKNIRQIIQKKKKTQLLLICACRKWSAILTLFSPPNTPKLTDICHGGKSLFLQACK